MASSPVLNPEIPYVGKVEGGLRAGTMVTIRGEVPPQAVRFAVNYQLGPTLNPRDDIAIHVSPRFPEGFVTRNSIESMTWGVEENSGPLWIHPGQKFEMIILCDYHCYKIAINGRHFAEFAHRLPFIKVTHLVIDGDVEIHSITFEQVSVDPPKSPATVPEGVPAADFGPPPPGGLYPTIQPQGGYGPPPAGYGPPPAGYGPPPPAGYGPPPPAGYGPPPDAYGGPGGYNPPRGYGYQPEKPEEEGVFGDCLDKVGLALGGLVAAGGVAAAMHAMNKKEESEEKDHEKTDAAKSKTESEGGFGNLAGSLGMALASSLASSALQGNTHAQQGYPAQPQSGGGGGGVLGSILGALGGGGSQQPAYSSNQPPAGDLGGTLGSLFGVLGGGGSQQPKVYQPSGGYGGYQPSGGQISSESDLLSGIGSALFNSALDGLSKRGKDKSHHEHHSGPPPSYEPSPPMPQSAPRPETPPSSGGHKLTADEISKGLGLDD
ncbi:hypothetical protein ACFW04_007347 [Cataglyphis niger]